MKTSKRIISLLLSALMLISVFQTGLAAFAVDGNGNASVLSASEAAMLPDSGAVVTSTEVVRVASGLYSYENGTAIVPATESGIPAMNGSYEQNSLANTGNINESAEYPWVKITFKDLPSDVPQIKCINTTSGTSNVVMSSPVYSEADKSYSWIIASGTANAGDTLKFEITYSYNSRTYVSYAYSYVENVSQPAGNYISTKYEKTMGNLGWVSEGKAGVSAASRLLGINTYSSLETFTMDSSTLRGYYNASSNTYVTKSTNDYSTYSTSKSSKDTDATHEFLINEHRSYADIYVDTSVTKSFSDLNLRYAVTKPEKVGSNSTQVLELVGLIKGNVDVNAGSFTGTGDYELGTSSTVGTMVTVGSEGTSQYITEFNGQTFTEGAEYTLVTRISSSNESATNKTVFPVGIRIHTSNKAELRALINDILHNNNPETPLISAENKGVNPQSWYYSSGFDAYQEAMLAAQSTLTNPRSTQSEIDNAVSALKSAYSSLVLKEADYTCVETATAAAEEYQSKSNLYTDESNAKLEKALSIYDSVNNPDGTIQYGYSVIFQPQVENWAQGIYDAIDNLEYRLADYTELNEAVANANEAEKNIDMYLDFSSVRAAVANIDYNVKITEQSKVDAMTATLNDALNNLKFKPADYTKVNEAVSKAQSYAASNYTEESYAKLRNILRSIDYTLTVDKQSEVDAYVTQIDNAISNLNELPANYAEVEALLKQIDELVERYYTPESYQSAKETAEECRHYGSYGITQQKEVDAIRDALQAAVDALVMYDADYSKIETYKKQYADTDLTNITSDSIARVDNAFSAVVYGLKIDKQSEVDSYALVIESALNGLSYKQADYTLVTIAVEKAKALDRSYYADMSAVDAAVGAVEYGYGVNRQDEVDAMAESINQAINDLRPGPADYARVNAQIEKFNALNENYYTKESMDKVRVVISKVKWNLTKEDQAEVTGYALDIAEAMLSLEEAPADYTELERIIRSIPDDLESQYTTESIKVLTDAQEKINWNLKAQNQQTVIGYQDTINKAISGLKYLTGDYSDVDAAIAEGRAIIEKNDPPISKESIASFEEFVAGIDRTYTIKQEAEIAVLASQIRAAYSVFTYAESVHKASISLSADRTASYPGDIVTVSVTVGTDYYAAASSIPVLYDSNFYTLVGASVDEAFAFEGTYAAGSEKGGSISSPAKGYPSSYTSAAKAQWKYALITLAPTSNLNVNAQILSPAQTVVKLQFKVNDITVSEGNSFTAKIWIDPLFQKTESYKNGKLYIGRFENETVDTNVVVSGQTIDLTNADININVINPNSPASFTELKAALIKQPLYDASYYTAESYKRYTDAVEVGNEVVSHTEYTVKQQSIVDNATDEINEAYNSLELKPATTDALVSALALTPAYSSDYYTTETYTAYANAVATGKSILNETGLTIVDNFRINAAAESIELAYGKLSLKPFSYTTEMDNALGKKPEYEESYYSEESYAAYDKAYKALETFKENGPSFLDDTEGMDLIYALNVAYQNLYLLDADTEELDSLVNTKLDYPSNYYTKDSYSAYESAVASGKEILDSGERLTVAYNERIEKAVSSINEAKDNLEFLPFSYEDELFELLDSASIDGDEDDYTEDSVNAFYNAYSELENFSGEYADIRDDETYLTLKKNLTDALGNLKARPADTSLLDEALALEVLDASYYESTTYKAYSDAIAAVEAYGEDYYWTLPEQDTLNELAQAIIDAHANLKLLSFTKLSELEAAIEVTPEYGEEYYQSEAYAAYLAKKKVITDMIENVGNLTIADEPKAMAAIDDYNTALEALKSAWADADYSCVTDAINEANGYNKNLYTNYDIVEKAIGDVVYGLNILEQEKVNAYAQAIKDACGKLQAKAGDYACVEEAIENYNEKVEAMTSTGIDIDDKTIDAVEKAIEAVVYELDATQQSQIDSFAEKINEAVAKLDYVSTIVLKSDSVATITDEGYIKGLSGIVSKDEIISNFTTYGNNTRIEVIATINGFGTGTVVQHFDGDNLIKEYVLVVDGDVDGDSFVSALDVTTVATYINEFDEPEEAYVKEAIDLCNDGWLDAIDLTIIIALANYEMM